MSQEQTRVFVSDNPGRDVQRVGTAGFLGQPPEKIYDPVWGSSGTWETASATWASPRRSTPSTSHSPSGSR